jgi:hypothetical protein
MDQLKRYILEQVAEGRLEAVKAAELLIGMEDGRKRETAVKEIPESYALSPAQVSIFIRHQLRRGTEYNIPRILFLEGDVDLKRITDIFSEIIRRHDSLRTSFTLYHGRYVQKVSRDVEFAIEYEEAEGPVINEEALKKFIRFFDLSKAPLFRAKLIKYGERNYAMMLDMHHIIADRQSIIVLMDEFKQLYGGEALPEIKYQFYNYIQWQEAFMKSEAWEKQESYWLNQYSAKLPQIHFRTDYRREEVKSFTENTVLYQFSDHMNQKLTSFCSGRQVTLNMLMLSAYYILLYRWLGEKDIVVGINSIGRNRAELSNMIGMLVNTLAIRNKIDGNKTFIQFLSDTRMVLLSAYENQEYTYEILLEKLRKHHKQTDISLINTLFVMQNNDFGELDLDGLSIEQYNDYIKTDARFDLQVNIFHTGNNKLNLCFIYCKELYREDSIQKLLNAYLKILEQTLDEPEKIIDLYEFQL